MKFSIIAINFNQHKYCRLFIEAIKMQLYAADQYEVIVFDDGSTPPLATALKDIPPNVRFIHAPRTATSGRAKARNQAAASAIGEYFVFVDGDCMLNRNCLNQYAAHFRDNPDRRVVLGSYCHLVESDIPPNCTETFLNNLDELDPYNRHDNRFRTLKLGNFKLSQLNISWLLFVSRNFCIERKLFIDSGGFNEGFLGWGSEDTEFAYRLDKLQQTYDLTPNKVFHIAAAETHGLEKAKYQSWMRNVGLFYSLHKDPKILLLMMQEKLIHDCFCLGHMWNVELQINTFHTIQSRAILLDS